VDGIEVVGEAGSGIILEAGKMIPFHLFLAAQPGILKGKKMPIHFVLESLESPVIRMEYESVFIGPAGY